ncbi:uncharacterized protein OCT59_016983 [Rhizophagus irregularis]|nr:hypothetical protein OCT59_016983 [Rhizophagus irregularis]CAB4476811.1 unnamed protein product [Rhizophagus irregularis]
MWQCSLSTKKLSNISEEFLNEWRLHLQCQCEALSNGSGLVPLFGITQDPNTKNYMVVMGKMPLDNLRNNLMVKKYNPNDKFNNLLLISAQLEAIHKLDLVHGDRRKINYSTKLNEMLEQEELSDKFVIMEDNNNDMSESLANCVIKD